jgi:hypothetical protein
MAVVIKKKTHNQVNYEKKVYLAPCSEVKKSEHMVSATSGEVLMLCHSTAKGIHHLEQDRASQQAQVSLPFLRKPSWGPTNMTSSNPNHLLKMPPPNTINK